MRFHCGHREQFDDNLIAKHKSLIRSVNNQNKLVNKTEYEVDQELGFKVELAWVNKWGPTPKV